MSAGSQMPVPDDVVDFWFDAGPKKWFSKSETFDEEIRSRFGPTVAAAGAGDLDDWQVTPQGVLALVLLLDQFTRNIFRGDPRTWGFDDKAVAVSEAAIAKGYDMALPLEKRRWLYMPYMHSEDPAMQRRSVELSEKVDDADYRKFARHHAEIVERFGRFPHRNELLGRDTTPEEAAWLDEGGFSG